MGGSDILRLWGKLKMSKRVKKGCSLLFWKEESWHSEVSKKVWHFKIDPLVQKLDIFKKLMVKIIWIWNNVVLLICLYPLYSSLDNRKLIMLDMTIDHWSKQVLQVVFLCFFLLFLLFWNLAGEVWIWKMKLCWMVSIINFYFIYPKLKLIARFNNILKYFIYSILYLN